MSSSTHHVSKSGTFAPGKLPTEPGWYVAKMKTWPLYDSGAFVKVFWWDGELKVTQCGDERLWDLGQWTWRRRVYT